MATEQQRLTSGDRENLVAYLDGELGDEEARVIATKLTQSVSARREVDDLRRTWDLLDRLPRPDVPPDFATRTATMAAGAASIDERLVDAAGRTARLVARAGIAAAIVLACLGAGYAALAFAWPDPTARLARDLSMAEHLDEYQDVGSFEFLKQLDDSAQFNRLED